MTIDRYVEAAGWRPHLAAIVVSERVGAIKPHPAIFRAAEAALADAGEPPLDPGRILHVGDDWAADVVGRRRAPAGAPPTSRVRPADSPLPGERARRRRDPDLVLERLADLETGAGERGRADARSRRDRARAAGPAGVRGPAILTPMETRDRLANLGILARRPRRVGGRRAPRPEPRPARGPRRRRPRRRG